MGVTPVKAIGGFDLVAWFDWDVARTYDTSVSLAEGLVSNPVYVFHLDEVRERAARGGGDALDVIRVGLR